MIDRRQTVVIGSDIFDNHMTGCLGPWSPPTGGVVAPGPVC